MKSNKAPDSFETFIRSTAQGASLGFSNKAEAALAATLVKYGFNDPRDFKQLYKLGLLAVDDLSKKGAEKNPKSAISGSLTGGAFLPWKATSLGGNIATGAGYGALTGIGSNPYGDVLEGPTPDDLIAGAKGGAIGGALGAAIPTVIEPTIRYGAKQVGKLGAPIKNAINKIIPDNTYLDPQIPENIAAFEKYNIPFKKSDVTGDPANLLIEENALLGQFGAEPQKNMQQFQQNQNEAYKSSLENLQNNVIGAGQPFIEKGTQAQSAVNELTQKAIQEYAPIKEAYNAAKKQVGTLDVNEVSQFPNIARSVLQSPEVSLGQSNAAGAYNQLKAFEELFAPKEGVIGVDFRGLETWRQGLNKALSNIESGQNKNGVEVIKKTFDDWIDNTIERALIAGDKSVLSKFKEARSLNQQWMQKYYGNNKKDVGKRFVKEMVSNAKNEGESLTPEIIVNKILGTSELGFSNDAALIVKELKTHLPEQAMDKINSEIGARLLKPLTKNTPNVTTYLNNLNKFLSENHSLAKEALKPSQIQELKGFGEVTRKLYGAKNNSRINPSGTNIRQKMEKIADKKYGFIKQIFAKSPVEFNQNALKKQLLKGEVIERAPLSGLKGLVPYASE